MGLLDWLRSPYPARPQPRDTSPASTAAATRVLAIVLLREPVPADGQAVIDHLRGQGVLGDPLFLPITDVSEERGMVVCRIPGGTVTIRSHPTPIPARELERPVALAWQWPAAREEVAAHRGHILVEASSTEADLMHLFGLQARLVGAVVATTPSAGVYVPDAAMVRSRGDWLDEALTTERDNFSLLLWVGVNPVREADGRVSAYTTGMSRFGMMELEVWASARGFQEMLDRVCDAIDDQVWRDRPLDDGEMFGYPVEDRHPVRHLPSRFAPGTRAVVLEGGEAAAGNPTTRQST
ncbi:DUF4261 domain-containing protein [Longimicrobium sp.]|uniref:DUF4261 domain-containing protein n=1 Tax=Longimicrobium sp. TaxID=2029185 RepID=UPI003B3A5020